jgi:ectoine hydroxylase-related dioxygenase (phytanoyl-CoA dioxygenase family)
MCALHDPAALASEADRWAGRLGDAGYCIIDNLIAGDEIARLDADLAEDFAETPFCQGGFYGERTKRFGRLLVRSPRAADLVSHPLITAIAERVLGPWCDTIQLNLSQAIALHPGAPAQLPHRDQDMWRGAIGEAEYLINVMWPLTPYRRANGATLIWPASHGPRALAPTPPPEDPLVAELDPGSALVFLGSTLHGAGENESDEVRRGIIVSYCLGWLKPYENQWLAYPPEVARNFPSALAALVGYRQHRPNLGNFEGQCPSMLLRNAMIGRLGAIDALRPDQEALVADYVARQRPAHQC